MAFLVVPWGLAWLTNPRLAEAYQSLSASQFLTPLLFGAGWGVSQVLLGVSFSRVGMALTFAIVIGLSASLGTVIPLLTLNPGVFATGNGLSVLLGIAIMVVGIYLCAMAGRERERLQGTSCTREASRSGYGTALAITITAGVFTPMLNYALAFGKPVLQRSIEVGASPASATYAVWVIALLGGLPINLLYCFYLLSRNKTWGAFTVRSQDWLVLNDGSQRNIV